jgi:hypothetical protein
MNMMVIFALVAGVPLLLIASAMWQDMTFEHYIYYKPRLDRLVLLAHVACEPPMDGSGQRAELIDACERFYGLQYTQPKAWESYREWSCRRHCQHALVDTWLVTWYLNHSYSGTEAFEPPEASIDTLGAPLIATMSHPAVTLCTCS